MLTIRYNLLLRELIKVTDVEHVDYEKLQHANDRISLINQTINAQRAEFETMAMFQNLHNRLTEDGEQAVETSEIEELLLHPDTKKPLREYKGYEGPARITISSEFSSVSFK
jgi:hypothetical protein